MLNKIRTLHHLPHDLYIKIKKNIHFEFEKDQDEINQFVNELPPKLKMQVSLYIYEDQYRSLKFFKNKPVNFIVWLCPLLGASYAKKGDNIYADDDRVTHIYFMSKG